MFTRAEVSGLAVPLLENKLFDITSNSLMKRCLDCIASHVLISGGVEIHESCFIGGNATLRNHITIGEKRVIRAGALLLSDAEPEGVYIGQATERSRISSTRLRKI